jgi:hypothetical protein
MNTTVVAEVRKYHMSVTYVVITSMPYLDYRHTEKAKILPWVLVTMGFF